MDNLKLYDKVREVPETALKEIKGGRLSGMTDINPMWRIKVLTEQFGVAGFGWKTETVREWTDVGANGEITANVEIKLYVKMDGAWSDGIVGVGGSKLVAKETSGLYTDDECYKKAYTDALSVACKALGIGADVYYEKDTTKYAGIENNIAKPTEKRTKDEKPKNEPWRLSKAEMMAKYAVENTEKAIEYYEKALSGKKMSDWTKEDTDAVRADLLIKKKKKETKQQLEKVDGELPFEIGE